MSETKTLVENEIVNDIEIIKLNRPEKLNAFNLELLEDLHTVLTNLTEATERPFVLMGNGDTTTAGADVDFLSRPDYPENFPEYQVKKVEIYSMIDRYPLPTAMAGKGAVVGLGFAFTFFTDFVILGEGTHYSYPEIKLGIAAPNRTIEQLKTYVGPRLTKEILLTGDPIPPSRALELGLVNYVVPEDEVEDKAIELLARINEHDKGVVKYLIDNLDVTTPQGPEITYRGE